MLMMMVMVVMMTVMDAENVYIDNGLLCKSYTIELCNFCKIGMTTFITKTAITNKVIIIIVV
eukprot:5097645-Karenia_brevis.AAC.1